jgi:hypothetical protein
MTSTRITINGQGSCAGAFVGTSGTNTVTMQLDGAGSFGCDVGAGGMVGIIIWTPALPEAQNTFQTRVATVGNVVNLVFTDTHFDATATLAWPATDLQHCIATGTESASLTGVLAFETT